MAWGSRGEDGIPDEVSHGFSLAVVAGAGSSSWGGLPSYGDGMVGVTVIWRLLYGNFSVVVSPEDDRIFSLFVLSLLLFFVKKL